MSYTVSQLVGTSRTDKNFIGRQLAWVNGSTSNTGYNYSGGARTTFGQTYNFGTKNGIATTINVGSGLLVGVQAYWNDGGSKIQGISFTILKPFTSIAMTQFSYDQGLNDPNSGAALFTQPVTIASGTWQNMSVTDSTNWTFTDSISRAVMHEWSSSTAVMFGASVTIEAEELIFAKETATATWSITNTQTTTNSITDTLNITFGANGVLSKGNGVQPTATIYQGVLNIGYSATMTITFEDGSNMALTDYGVYKNVQYTSAEVQIQTYPSSVLSSAPSSFKASIDTHNHKSNPTPAKKDAQAITLNGQIEHKENGFLAAHPEVNGLASTPNPISKVDNGDDLDDKLRALGNVINSALQAKAPQQTSV